MRVLSHSALQLARDDLGGDTGDRGDHGGNHDPDRDRGDVERRGKGGTLAIARRTRVWGSLGTLSRLSRFPRKHHVPASSAFVLRASSRASSTGFVLRASSLVFVSRFDRSSYQERRPEQRLVNAALRLCCRLCPQFGLLSALGLEH